MIKFNGHRLRAIDVSEAGSAKAFYVLAHAHVSCQCGMQRLGEKYWDEVRAVERLYHQSNFASLSLEEFLIKLGYTL